MPTEQEYIDKAIRELLNPTLDITAQYLEVISLVYESGLPKVERVETGFYDNRAAVYFQVKGAPFFLEVHITSDLSVDFVWTESSHTTEFTAVSRKVDYQELSAMTNLKPLYGWSKGDLRPNGKSYYDFSRISFSATESKAYNLNQQLDILLAKLEQDKTGILRLGEVADTIISIHRQSHVSGNSAIKLDAHTMQRISALNLGIDIGTSLYGEQLR